MAGHPLTADQADYLETLAELAEAYESANYPTPPPCLRMSSSPPTSKTSA